MRNESDSAADAPLAESGSSARSALPSREGEPLLTAAMDRLAHQLGETNVRLLVLADQTAKCLAHISLLLDLLVSSEEEEQEQERAYLDGSPIL